VTTLTGYGISLDLPAGWEARITMRDPEPLDAAHAAAARGTEAATTGALVHAANFALPTETGDFGAGAVELMANPDLLVILFEYDRASASMPMFAASGLPRVRADDFSPVALQRVLEGQGGVQKFFNQAGRAMCLYVVLGSYARRVRTVPVINDLLGRVTIT
jgi:hypothetical protein